VGGRILIVGGVVVVRIGRVGGDGVPGKENGANGGGDGVVVAAADVVLEGGSVAAEVVLEGGLVGRITGIKSILIECH
jgi:hypothetical protein